MYDVPSDKSNEELNEKIYTQNFSDKMSREQFYQHFKLRFKIGPREKHYVHHVIEVSPQMRREILNRSRLYLKFTSHNAKDYLVLARCNICQDLGHVSKYCKQKDSVCAHCGEIGHRKDVCEKKQQPAVCIPCSLRNKKCAPNRKDCPTYNLLWNRMLNRIDYGQSPGDHR